MGIKLPIEKVNERIPKISSLTALQYIESHVSKSGVRKSKVLCKCVCGKEVMCGVTDLMRGNPLSCGCTSKKGRKSFYTIGDSKLYKRWYDVRERCYNTKCSGYKHYGAKGVRMCEEWLNDYVSFAKWALKNGYNPELQLDKDIKGDGKLYSPETCSWVTHLVNMREKDSVIKLEYKGEIKTISEIAQLVDIPYAVLLARYNKVKDIDKAINFEHTPNHKIYSN